MTSKSDKRRASPDDVFQCQQCGECCRGFGGTYVNPEERRAIADFLGISLAQFEAEHCSASGSKMVLAQGSDGFCRFYSDKLCGIHPVKPRMCRRWPFIQAVLVDPANWHSMAAQCPGMKTDVSDEVIREAVARAIKGTKSGD